MLIFIFAVLLGCLDCVITAVWLVFSWRLSRKPFFSITFIGFWDQCATSFRVGWLIAHPRLHEGRFNCGDDDDYISKWVTWGPETISLAWSLNVWSNLIPLVYSVIYKLNIWVCQLAIISARPSGQSKTTQKQCLF